MAYSGFMDTTSPERCTPNYPPGSMSDILTGTNMAAADHGRVAEARPGPAGAVSIGTSQVQTMLWMQSQNVGMARPTLGQRPERFAPDATTNPLFTVYRTADGWIAIAALRWDQWPTIATAVGADHLLDDDRFATFDDIVVNRDEFRPVFAAHLQTEPTAHWWELLRAVDIWVAPVNRLEDLADDEHIKANDYLVRFEDGFTGPPAPFEVDGWRGARGGAADYGADTDAVLAELGYDDEAIVGLKLAGAAW